MNKSSSNRDCTIKVPILARVEGEGALDLVVKQGRIADLKLRIFEPPRLFEKFLQGRAYGEVPDLVARICGICPVAYQMSAVHALENLFVSRPGTWIRDMRRVLYCGEWLQSHALHINLLAAPDFLGYPDAISMAQDHPEVVKRGMRLQLLGDRLVSLFGARSVHPIGVRVGGFFRAPKGQEVEETLEALNEGIADARNMLAWMSGLTFPDINQAFTSVALRHVDEYPMNEGRIVSSDGLNIAVEDYQRYFQEYQAPHSTAFHAHLHGKPYLVGPLARLNLNWDLLPPEIRQAAQATGIEFPSRNMFHSIVARAVEIYYAVLEAIRLLENYHYPAVAAVEVTPRAGEGVACTEAPRGILWHRYVTDEQGRLLEADIVPPTSQNQARIEEDLHHSLTAFGLEHDDSELRAHAEQVIRNYDPCISCSTHFLRLDIKRE